MAELKVYDGSSYIAVGAPAGTVVAFGFGRLDPTTISSTTSATNWQDAFTASITLPTACDVSIVARIITQTTTSQQHYRVVRGTAQLGQVFTSYAPSYTSTGVITVSTPALRMMRFIDVQLNDASLAAGAHTYTVQHKRTQTGTLLSNVIYGSKMELYGVKV